MVRLADHHRQASPLRGLADNAVNPGDIGAGGVDDGAAPRSQRCVHPVRLPMGPYEHRGALWRLLGSGNGHRPHILQPPDHMVVMGDVPQQVYRPLRRRPFRQLHRPAHAIAEARRLGQHHLHAARSFSVRMRSISSSAMR